MIDLVAQIMKVRISLHTNSRMLPSIDPLQNKTNNIPITDGASVLVVTSLIAITFLSPCREMFEVSLATTALVNQFTGRFVVSVNLSYISKSAILNSVVKVKTTFHSKREKEN